MYSRIGGQASAGAGIFFTLFEVKALRKIMSNTQFAFLKRASVPSQGALQDSINSLGFNLKIDPALNFFEDSGFSPCELDGTDNVGFELFCKLSEEVTVDYEELTAIVAERDICISFSWGGSTKDLACAMIVCYALAKDFDAIISYEGDVPDSLSDFLSATTEIMEDAMKEASMDHTASVQADRTTDEGEIGDTSVTVQISIFGADGKKIDSQLNAPDYWNLNKRQMALMELWASGTITSKQRSKLAEVDAALFKLKNK